MCEKKVDKHTDHNYTDLMKLRILFSSLVMILTAINLNCARENLVTLLPAARDDWTKSGKPEIYDRDNLFDYMDGGAELYLAYDFERLVVQRYISASKSSLSKNSITVEIYQMTSSADAYGLFSFDQVGERVEIGQKGVYGYGLLKFWKDGFLVRILGSQDDLRETIFQLAKNIDQKIKTKGEPPRLLSKIPKHDLIPDSDHFFHKQMLLNNLYFLSDKNILKLSDETDCILADFKVDEQILKFLLIEYRDSTEARNAYQKFNESYLKNEASEKNRIIEVEEGKLVGMDLERNYLMLVFEGTEKKMTLRLLDSVKNHFK